MLSIQHTTTHNKEKLNTSNNGGNSNFLSLLLYNTNSNDIGHESKTPSSDDDDDNDDNGQTSKPLTVQCVAKALLSRRRCLSNGESLHDGYNRNHHHGGYGGSDTKSTTCAAKRCDDMRSFALPSSSIRKLNDRNFDQGIVTTTTTAARTTTTTTDASRCTSSPSKDTNFAKCENHRQSVTTTNCDLSDDVANRKPIVILAKKDTREKSLTIKICDFSNKSILQKICNDFVPNFDVNSYFTVKTDFELCVLWWLEKDYSNFKQLEYTENDKKRRAFKLKVSEVEDVTADDDDDVDEVGNKALNNIAEEEDAFKSSRRLKRLEEHFKGLVQKKDIDFVENQQNNNNDELFIHGKSFVRVHHSTPIRNFNKSLDLSLTNSIESNLTVNNSKSRSNNSLSNGKSKNNSISISEFDVRYLESPLIVDFECYDEFDEIDSISSELEFNDCECDCQQCLLIAKTNGNGISATTTTTSSDFKYLADSAKMRELNNGQLRGLLKNPNRPPPVRKNRVVFDETRNEFFEADYIILIREDCAYDEEDEEPCTCGEHELVRLCCEEGCQCNYTNEDNRTPQSPKYAPPVEFVDDAALSPPDGYKDNGLKNALGGALSGHIFGAQHIQQLQVIQRLQQQRAAMLAARSPSQGSSPVPPQIPSSQQPSQEAVAAAAQQGGVGGGGMGLGVQQAAPPADAEDAQPVCSECAECVECAAKQMQEAAECNSAQCQQQEEIAQLSVPGVALVPVHSSSPERRITQKEIIAGEERPKYILPPQYKAAAVVAAPGVIPGQDAKDKLTSVQAKNQRFVVETITMTTVTERRIVETTTTTTEDAGPPTTTVVNNVPVTASGGPPVALEATMTSTAPVVPMPIGVHAEKKPPLPAKPDSLMTAQISGILKGGKLWKAEQNDDSNNATSTDDESGSKRSVRFITEDGKSRDGDGEAAPDETENQINELIPIKKHSTLFNNSLRPNSAVRQLFPATPASSSTVITNEALRAFDESKRAGNLLPNLVPGDSDTIRRSIERNILRRSLIKKKAIKSDISLEDRIKQLTCDIDESAEDHEDADLSMATMNELNHRDSPTGEENPQQKFIPDKSFSPSSSVSSSSSGSSSAYKKISDIFNRDKKQDKIPEMEENPIVIIPQECRCPAAPDLGMGVQVPAVHTQIHQTPPRQTEPKRQFLSTLAPLTACVAGQKDDLGYYTLAAGERHHHHSHANTHFSEYNLGDIEAVLINEETRKVAPDVIAGTPGQEQDELAAFAQQEAIRTEKIKKRYTNDASNASSDDDEQNDYGFNKRPSVRGIKPKFSSTNEILQQMQEQLSQPATQSQTAVKSYTLPKQSSSSALNANKVPQPQPLIPQQQQQQQQQQQVQLQNQLQQQMMQANPAAMAAAVAHQQHSDRAWSFYSDADQRIPNDGNVHPGYYQTLPAAAFRQTAAAAFHGHEESLMYQNCQSVTMEQHYSRYARSPTRRPESPPPLRNYHQTMVLIPYNAETYSQYAAIADPKMAAAAGHQIHRQNILEYQQVTQQTIRVPIGYTLPTMQLHVVANRGGQPTSQYPQQQQQQQQQHQPQRILAPRGYNYPQDGSAIGFSERGVPEGAAAVSHTDCKNILSPTSSSLQLNQQQQQQQANCTQSTVTSNGPAGSVYYAMNV